MQMQHNVQRILCTVCSEQCADRATLHNELQRITADYSKPVCRPKLSRHGTSYVA